MTKFLTSLPDADSKLALLKISDLWFVFPHRDIGALESTYDIDTHEAEPFSVGCIKYKNQGWPVYCLSPELSLLSDIPAERRACILLSAGAGYIGVLFDEISIAKQEVLGKRQELPPAMRLPDTPVIGLVQLAGNNVACITGAEQIIAHIERLAKT
jgi:hypothetical protein